MIVTTTSFGQYELALIAGANENESSKIVVVDWLKESQSWLNSKSFPKLKKHYKLDDSDFEFIDKNSLSIDDATQALLLAAIGQINEYLNGERKDFDLPLDLSSGTDFQQRVWRELQTIPHGEAISYATLAQLVNNPKSYRAVANANGKNPFSIIVPCHRVISSDGKLGGYTGGLDKKEYLLALEGVKCKG
ncbi:methylated-DNA--[protein]-cysteine S-methyltransferase [Psychrobacter sp. LV10R520-6]|uniref:methylated-DNA--[protein]-cysteine S-methyltransferase n=1 Tax=Psychrobacter sp. LV10R520-6 TaxID=1415574 RepID=UPI0024C77788|nr:methylated-DNA--[protein]-cysteine S-methyltransferase [Psychrobacter sp. LV10R520-6]SNT69723.1 methylated-DNA-[protein]-cysteine S-methyltransferase [Psychrobacter sp. LV10R520-6]